tara:strand:- start:1668 stop:2360 length:693 start_codon:yes stop_codon:yes gene_type:complete
MGHHCTSYEGKIVRISIKDWVRQYREPWSKVFFTAFRQWRADKMEKTRMQFSGIHAGSVVFDMGGFQGNWAADIHERYGADVHIFEPHPAFAQKIRQRFEGNSAIRTYDLALGSTQSTLTLSDDGDASSSFREGKNAVTGRIEPVAQFFEHADIPRIDLMKINIEGGEYDLLPALAAAGIMPRIGIIQVQFHLFSAADIERRDTIRTMLEKTHTCDWSYDFVWEQWSLRL